jgi:hypothetical protein
MLLRRPKKRTVLIVGGLVLLLGFVAALWEINDWPPIGLILKYGFPPTGGPTGNTCVIEGVEFVELKPGYCRIDIWDEGTPLAGSRPDSGSRSERLRISYRTSGRLRSRHGSRCRIHSG